MEELAAEPQAGHPVDGVARHGQIDRCEMNPDLVRSPRLQAHAQQRMLRKRLLDGEVRERVPRRVRLERPSCRIAPVAADRSLDRSPPRTGSASDEREVLPFHTSAAHEALEPAVRILATGDDEQPGCLAIEAMDDSRALLDASCGAVGAQGSRQRRSGSTCPGVHDESGWLVDDEQMRVLPDDVQIELGLDPLFGRRQLPGDQLPTRQPVALRPPCAVDDDGAAVDQALRRSARADLLLGGEEAVQAQPVRLRRNADLGQSRSVEAPGRRRGARSPAISVPSSSMTPMTMNVSARLNAGQ